MSYTIKKPLPKHPPRKRLLLIVGGVIIGLAAILTGLELTNTTYLLHSKPVAKTATITATTNEETDTKGSDKPAPPAETPATPVAGEDNKGVSDTPVPSPTTPNGAAPDTPSGTFISNHSPSLDGDPSPSGVQSVCMTTPGAQCGITFTKDGLTRTLAAQKTNSDGYALWNWDIKQAGFVEGTWAVTVTATLNGKTATAQDTLQVGP